MRIRKQRNIQNRNKKTKRKKKTTYSDAVFSTAEYDAPRLMAQAPGKKKNPDTITNENSHRMTRNRFRAVLARPTSPKEGNAAADVDTFLTQVTAFASVGHPRARCQPGPITGVAVRVSAFVLAPASDSERLEELREQTVHLLASTARRPPAQTVLPEQLFLWARRAPRHASSEIGGLFGRRELHFAGVSGSGPFVFRPTRSRCSVDLARPGRDERSRRGAEPTGVEIADDRKPRATLDAPQGAGLLIARADGDRGLDAARLGARLRGGGDRRRACRSPPGSRPGSCEAAVNLPTRFSWHSATCACSAAGPFSPSSR